MTRVKSEPNSDSISTTHVHGSKGVRLSSSGSPSDGYHSRQALANKPVNHISGAQNKDKESQIRKIESFLLKPGQVVSGKDMLAASIKKEREQESPTRELTEPLLVPAEVAASKTAGPAKRHAQEGSERPPKKREPDDKFKELSSFVETEKKRDREPRQATSPGPYTPIDKLLYETRGEESASLFRDLEQQSERDFCSLAASWTLAEWIEEGQHLLDTHTRLISRLVQHRIELSLKLQVITSAVNDRAAALNEQGLLVDRKLEKIKNLGEEILHII